LHNRKFAKKFEVRYYEVNKLQEVAPVFILNYLEETAIAHTESVGLGIDRLKSEGIGWILNRWSLEINSYPHWNDIVEVETWAADFDRFFATREFCIRDSSGSIIGKASSRWIFLDITKKRPSRIPAHIADAYGIYPQRMLDDPFEKLNPPNSTDFEKEFHIRKSDIDTNEHVNNASFVSWCLETVPSDVYESCRLYTLEIEYKKEARYGSDICSVCKNGSESPSKHIFLHSVRKKDDSTDLAFAVTTWLER